MACLILSLAPNVPLLFLGILGLRLTGQGLLSLTASTTMARVFDEGRGKALSISGLGYPLGEGLLPVAVVLLIHAVGWRWSWGILAAVIALLLLPAMASLLRRVEPFHQREIAQHRTARPRTPLLRDRRFYLLLPGSLYLPLVLTALWAEVYGVASIGATKGMVATFGILATAIGPVLLGGLLAVGVTFTTVVPACALAAVAIALLSLVTRRSLILPTQGSPRPL
jgi:MFS family permease